MAWAALILWVLTALGGFYLLVTWLQHGGMQQGDRPGRRIKPPLILGHFALAATGLVLWIIYVASDSDALAWIAFVLLLIVALLGFTMLAAWLGLAGFFSVFALIKEPNGTMAQVLTYVPMLSPFVTPMRHSISPLPWPVLLGSIAATVLGLLAVVWLAARIYRVGILMYGKRASLREVARWIAAT